MAITDNMQRKKINSITKPLVFLVVAIVLLLAMVGYSFAWFIANIKHSRTEKLELTLPPTIFLKDDHLKNMTTFHLDGLKVGVEYNSVFCVAPAIHGSVKTFFLGLIYTQNIGMEINLYPVFSVTEGAEEAGAEYKQVGVTQGQTTYDCYYNFYKSNNTKFDNEVLNGYTYKTTYGDWHTETKPQDWNLNSGIYKSYDGLKFSTEKNTSPELLDELNDTSSYRFFVLNITWAEDSVIENVKEADVVYIVAQESKQTNNQS